jgi:hypothetical protein
VLWAGLLSHADSGALAATLPGMPARLSDCTPRPTWPCGRPPTPTSGDRPVATTRCGGACLERRVAWFLRLLDAYDPGRLGRAVDVRTTALDQASRKAIPTMSTAHEETEQ